MVSIIKISNSIADKIAKELEYNDDKKEVIAYGLFGVIQTIISISILIIIGLIFNMVWQILILSIVTSILRKYSGGVHASTSISCIVVGTITCCIQLFLCNIIVRRGISFYVICISGIILFTYCYATINRLAPVQNKNKIIKSKKKIKKMKTISMFILTAYLITVIVSGVMYYKTNWTSNLYYIVCVYLGTLWQVFTLTKSGHYLLFILDNIFNSIFIKMGGKINE